MAELTDPQKREIVEALACFATTVEVIDHFRREHGLEINHKQVGAYDPTKHYYEAGERWREMFHERRKAYLEDVQSVPAANQGYRLRILQEGIEAAKARKDWELVASLLEQSAKEVGGVLTNERNLKVDDSRRQRVADMTPEERRMAMAELIRAAMEAAPARLAAVIEGKAEVIE